MFFSFAGCKTAKSDSQVKESATPAYGSTVLSYYIDFSSGIPTRIKDLNTDLLVQIPFSNWVGPTQNDRSKPILIARQVETINKANVVIRLRQLPQGSLGRGTLAGPGRIPAWASVQPGAVPLEIAVSAEAVAAPEKFITGIAHGIGNILGLSNLDTEPNQLMNSTITVNLYGPNWQDWDRFRKLWYSNDPCSIVAYCEMACMKHAPTLPNHCPMPACNCDPQE